MITQEYDVCVIGSGPGGSTAATLIAMAGHRVLLVEKEALPVYKIGESLLPSTIHGICPLLGVSEELNRQNFIKKLGGTFLWGRNRQPWTFAFAESARFPGPTSFAYQVERIKFDSILLDNAKRKGVEVREQTRAQDLFWDSRRVVGVRLISQNGLETRVSCRYVIDASGYTSTLARHAGDRRVSDRFQNVAVFGYFVDGGRLPGPNAGNIFSAVFEKGWFWYIPLSTSLTSVGAVIGREYAALLQDVPELAFKRLISESEHVKTLLAAASPCTIPPYHKIRIRKDYSYSHSRFWIPGLVLVGDAACFIDPVFSSGVHLATYSALLAARSINTRLRHEFGDEMLFDEFETRYRREFTLFYEFLTAFYDVDQDVRSYYWTARRLTAEQVTNREAFIALVGGNSTGELPRTHVSGGINQISLCDHLFPAAAGTSSDMYVESGERSQEGSRFLGELNRESTQLQLRSALGGVRVPERPIFKSGLVPSPDSLHWTLVSR